MDFIVPVLFLVAIGVGAFLFIKQNRDKIRSKAEDEKSKYTFPTPTSEVTGVNVTTDLSSIRVSDGTQITGPGPQIYPDGVRPDSPVGETGDTSVYRAAKALELKKVMLSNPETPEQVKFNELMSQGRTSDAYKHAFKYYYHGMGGGGGEFVQKIEEAYGNPGYKILIAKYS